MIPILEARFHIAALGDGLGFRTHQREKSGRRRISAQQHPGEIELVVVLARDEVDGAVVAHGQIVVAVRLGRVVTAKIWETNMQGKHAAKSGQKRENKTKKAV